VPPPLSFKNQVRIDSNRGVVDEYLAVYLPYIDVMVLSGRNHRDGMICNERYAEIFGKVI
jgi:hypothetical protein